MAIPTLFSELSTTAASNPPAGSDNKSTADDHMRQIYAFVRSLYEGSTNGQISFPATQNASSGANVLDDYEEGTFTPTITFGGASTGITYATQAGRYVKVGKMVYASIRFTLTSKGSSTGVTKIAGLPFTAVNATPAGGGNASYYAFMVGLAYGMTAQITPNATTASIRMQGAEQSAELTEANFSDTSEFQIELTYEAAA